MKLFKNEKGRSMVEMLGVLAIIGVLSVGGVTGYRYAMDRILLNKLQNFINQIDLAYLELREKVDLSIQQGENDQQYRRSLQVEFCSSGLLDKQYCPTSGEYKDSYFVIGDKIQLQVLEGISSEGRIHWEIAFYMPKQLCSQIPSLGFNENMFNDFEYTRLSAYLTHFYPEDNYQGFVKACEAERSVGRVISISRFFK